MGGAPDTPPSFRPHVISFPAPQQISPHLRLQAPLSRSGRGPGLVLVLDHYAQAGKSETRLDPEPLRKWAEEGFAVVQVRPYFHLFDEMTRNETVLVRLKMLPLTCGLVVGTGES